MSNLEFAIGFCQKWFPYVDLHMIEISTHFKKYGYSTVELGISHVYLLYQREKMSGHLACFFQKTLLSFIMVLFHAVVHFKQRM